MSLKTFLTTRNYYKQASKIYACIGADPSIGSAGWALVLRCVLPDNGYKDYVVEAGIIQSNANECLSNRLYGLSELFSYKVFNIMREIEQHNIKELKTIPKIELLGGALEVPAYLKGGKQRINRDLVQRESIAAMRIGFKKRNLFIVGDTSEGEPVRPNQVHALAGVANRKDTDDFNKKQAVLDWLQKTSVIIPEIEEAGDMSDAAGIAIVGLNILLGVQ